MIGIWNKLVTRTIGICFVLEQENCLIYEWFIINEHNKQLKDNSLKGKRAWSGNTTTTHCRPSHMMKNHMSMNNKIHQEDN